MYIVTKLLPRDTKKISIVGAGYVCLTTAACLAELGHKVTLIEPNTKKISALESGLLQVNEPDLTELWKRNLTRGRIVITDSYSKGIRGADFTFIAVSTMSSRTGKPDLKWVRVVARNIAQASSGPLIVVLKSTVPLGTAHLVRDLMVRYSRNGHSISVVSNPEFLGEGTAVHDFMNPTKTVVGGSDQKDIDAVAALYANLNSPIITCDNNTAEISKYASNTFVATSISFINEIALLCDECGADIKKVTEIAGLDNRQGEGISAGLGWGGGRLPKDVRGLIYLADTYRVPFPLMHAVERINQRQPRLVVEKLQYLIGSLRGKTIGILGLSFKAGSSEMLEARSIEVVRLLQDRGCKVKAYDPMAMEEAARIMPGVIYCEDVYKVADGSDALVLVTEWDEFKRLDFRKIASLMNRPVMVDGQNLFNPEEMTRAGFLYDGIGRRALGQKNPGEATTGLVRDNIPSLL
jgi:UDPglucose 6-dehydrogenase